MKKAAFTLVELIVSIAILLVVVGIAGLSVKKIIERNDYSKIVSIIPKIISVETNKAFEEGEEKTVELNLSSKYIEVGNTQKILPDNYSYSIYAVTKTDDGEIGESSNGESINKLTDDNSKEVIFTADKEGKINSVEIDTIPTSGFYTKYHPSILVEKNDDPFCRIDIVSSLYITPKILVYKPDGAESSDDDMNDKSKWILDSKVK